MFSTPPLRKPSAFSNIRNNFAPSLRKQDTIATSERRYSIDRVREAESHADERLPLSSTIMDSEAFIDNDPSQDDTITSQDASFDDRLSMDHRHHHEQNEEDTHLLYASEYYGPARLSPFMKNYIHSRHHHYHHLLIRNNSTFLLHRGARF